MPKNTMTIDIVIGSDGISDKFENRIKRLLKETMISRTALSRICCVPVATIYKMTNRDKRAGWHPRPSTVFRVLAIVKAYEEVRMIKNNTQKKSMIGRRPVSERRQDANT